MLTVADIAMIYRDIEVARFAIAHLDADIEHRDIEIASKALDRAAQVIANFLKEFSTQTRKEVEEEINGSSD